MRTLDEQRKRRPADLERVAEHKDEMRQQMRAARLKEIRTGYSVTQIQLAAQLQVSQNRVSSIERGQIDKTEVDTLRRYIEALGGTLTLEAHFGSDRFVLTD